jgi:peroxiredoxin
MFSFMPLLPNGVYKLDGATESPLQVGEIAPNFNRLDPQGKSVSLSNFAGKPTVVLFLGRLSNSITAGKLRKFLSMVPSIEEAGANALVVTNTYYLSVKNFFETFKGKVIPVLDDESHAEEVLTTYQQPTKLGFDYPVYVLNAQHRINFIGFGDDFFESDYLPKVLENLSASKTKPVGVTE